MIIDKWVGEIDLILRTLLPPTQRLSKRSIPGDTLVESALSENEKKQVIGLVRVNHAGEVCAQALYQGQALTAALIQVKEKMEKAALEETDHLAWCEHRLKELGGRVSFLNPLWYMGSFFIGAFAGWVGDSISLGFVAETEKQVEEHLEKHLQQLPKQDGKTKAILEQMQIDEAQHAQEAINAGAIDLPLSIKILMRNVSAIMTKTSYYL